MPYEIRDGIPTRQRRRFDVTPDLMRLLPGQSLFVPHLERGYPLASRIRQKTGRKIYAMKHTVDDIDGTTFWRE